MNSIIFNYKDTKKIFNELNRNFNYTFLIKLYFKNIKIKINILNKINFFLQFNFTIYLLKNKSFIIYINV